MHARELPGPAAGAHFSLSAWEAVVDGRCCVLRPLAMIVALPLIPLDASSLKKLPHSCGTSLDIVHIDHVCVVIHQNLSAPSGALRAGARRKRMASTATHGGAVCRDSENVHEA